jgi:hypothetical protein
MDMFPAPVRRVRTKDKEDILDHDLRNLITEKINAHWQVHGQFMDEAAPEFHWKVEIFKDLGFDFCLLDADLACARIENNIFLVDLQEVTEMLVQSLFEYCLHFAMLFVEAMSSIFLLTHQKRQGNAKMAPQPYAF